MSETGFVFYYTNLTRYHTSERCYPVTFYVQHRLASAQLNSISMKYLPRSYNFDRLTTPVAVQFYDNAKFNGLPLESKNTFVLKLTKYLT